MTQTQTRQSLQERAINAIRALTIDAFEAAGSGHPGMPLGAAPMGYTLYTKFMKFNPANDRWIDRDRYIQSAGHGSMLQYSLAHLVGYDLPMSELKRYRQYKSKTPGHPEHFRHPRRRDHHRPARTGNQHVGRDRPRRGALSGGL